MDTPASLRGNDAVACLHAAIRQQLPRARIVLTGSHYYGDAKPDSDYDLVVITAWPVRRGRRRDIAGQLARTGLRYDVHFVPAPLLWLGWKNLAGIDLGSGRRLALALTPRVRREVRANRLKMAWYHCLCGELDLAAIALLRVRLLAQAKDDRELFSLDGNRQLLECLRDCLDPEEYALYRAALDARQADEPRPIPRTPLLRLLDDSWQRHRHELFQLQHNLRYWAYALRHGRPRLLVDYNYRITAALRHRVHGDHDAAARELGQLVPVSALDAQLQEYTLLRMLDISGRGRAAAR